MDRYTAQTVYGKLEQATFAWTGENQLGGERGYTSPIYAVRLDAKIDEDMEDDRSYSLFVRVNPNVGEAGDALLYVLELAREHELDPALENAGIMLT